MHIGHKPIQHSAQLGYALRNWSSSKYDYVFLQPNFALYGLRRQCRQLTRNRDKKNSVQRDSSCRKRPIWTELDTGLNWNKRVECGLFHFSSFPSLCIIQLRPIQAARAQQRRMAGGVLFLLSPLSLKSKLYNFDLSWFCCTTCSYNRPCNESSQEKIGVAEFWLE